MYPSMHLRCPQFQPITLATYQKPSRVSYLGACVRVLKGHAHIGKIHWKHRKLKKKNTHLDALEALEA